MTLIRSVRTGRSILLSCVVPTTAGGGDDRPAWSTSISTASIRTTEACAPPTSRARSRRRPERRTRSSRSTTPPGGRRRTDCRSGASTSTGRHPSCRRSGWAATRTPSSTSPPAGIPSDADLCGYAASCIPQPGGPGLDALSDRLMWRLAYRNDGTRESLVVNHTVDVDGRDREGVRWYEIRDPGGAPVLVQAGTFSPDADNRWYLVRGAAGVCPEAVRPTPCPSAPRAPPDPDSAAPGSAACSPPPR